MREKILIDYANRDLNKEEVFHSSGYAQAQSGEAFGAAEGGKTASFAARQAINEQRKYIQGYRNARITNSFYGVRRAQSYTPPSQRGEGASGRHGEGGFGRNEGGFGRSEGGFGRSEGGSIRNRQSVGTPEKSRPGLRASRASREK